MSVPGFDPVIFTTPTPYSLKDYRDDIASPSPSLKARLVDAGVNAICTIHQNTPAAWLADQIVNDGKIAPEHILLDDLCRPRSQLPPPPVEQFQGGQCDAKAYRVFFAVVTAPGANPPDCGLRRTSGVDERGIVYGAVGGYQLKGGAVKPGECRTYGYSEIWITCRGTQATGIQPLGSYKLTGSSSGDIQSLSGFRVESLDGTPADSCGNPGLQYPPVLPSPDDLKSRPVIQITPTLNVPVAVEVKPTFKFDPTVIAPVGIVNVGGLTINFDLGGFTLSPDFSNNTNYSFPSTNPTYVNPTPVSNPSKHLADDIDVLEIIKRLDRIGRELEECCERDRPYPPPDANKVVTTVLGTANSGLFDLPKDTFQVTVSTLEHDIPIKMQAGDQSPTVLYSGWAWFGAANNMSERMPVDSQYKIYSPPRYVSNTFGFKLHVGLTAIIKAYSIKPKPVEP